MRRVREQRRGARPAWDLDPGSRRLLALTTWPVAWVSIATALLFPALTLPGGPALLGAGLAAVALGMALRWWAILALGRFFVGYVTVQEDHRVVDSGPYRWLRHPAYAGSWLMFAGIGLGTGSPLALLLCGAVPGIGFVRRARVEEQALLAAMPAAYTEYASRTWRLVPFVW